MKTELSPTRDAMKPEKKWKQMPNYFSFVEGSAKHCLPASGEGERRLWAAILVWLVVSGSVLEIHSASWAEFETNLFTKSIHIGVTNYSRTESQIHGCLCQMPNWAFIIFSLCCQPLNSTLHKCRLTSISVLHWSGKNLPLMAEDFFDVQNSITETGNHISRTEYQAKVLSTRLNQ